MRRRYPVLLRSLLEDYAFYHTRFGGGGDTALLPDSVTW